MAPTTQLSAQQWIASLFPWKLPTQVGGRPKALPRDCLEGILWILRTGARWKDLPKHFPSDTTCWRKLRDWTRDGAFQRAWDRLLRKLEGMHRLDRREALADGTFSSSKSGAEVGTTKKGKGSKIMLCNKGHGLPIAVLVKRANPAEVTLIELLLLAARVIRRKPQRLLYDRAADSDPLHQRLRRRGIDLICPHRKSRKKPKTQDSRLPCWSALIGRRREDVP